MIRNELAQSTAPFIEFVPAPQAATEFNVDRRTLGRWIHDASSGLPTPVRITVRLYFKRSELEAWKLSRAIASVRPSKTCVAAE
jgi:hypothetical protein